MSKNNNRGILSNLSEISDLPIDIIAGRPLFHLYSDRELIIENAKNLEYYDENSVRISLDKMTVSVRGKDLCIKFLANFNMTVSGYIETVSIEHHIKH